VHVTLKGRQEPAGVCKLGAYSLRVLNGSANELVFRFKTLAFLMRAGEGWGGGEMRTAVMGKWTQSNAFFSGLPKN
jgi:hypothetical protein